MDGTGSPQTSTATGVDRYARHPWLRVYRALRPFFARHRRLFAIGATFALLVVGMRLALPWPLRALMEIWLHKKHHRAAWLADYVPAGWDLTLTMGAAFCVIISLLGLCDYLARLYFARFAIASVRDLRSNAFRRLTAQHPNARSLGSGDLVARLVGDSARVKAGLKGFLVHIATNGVMFVGVTIVLLTMNMELAAVFMGAGLFASAITYWGARRTYQTALRYRTKEGRLADVIHESRSSTGAHVFNDANESSGQYEAALTGIQGTTTWCAHIALGVAVLAGLWVGMRAVAAERLEPGDVLVFIMYALMLRAPTVQLARQGTRTGKIFACGERLAILLDTTVETHGVTGGLAPLADGVDIVAARVTGRRGGARQRLLGPCDLRINAGEHVAVVGATGSGKTTLLELLAGRRKYRGTVYWDGTDLAGVPGWPISNQIGFVTETPTWARQSIRSLLGLPRGDVAPATVKVLRDCGLRRLLTRLPRGIDTVVGPHVLSITERRGLALARTLLGDASLCLIDDPTSFSNKNQAAKAVKAILTRKAGRTVVVSMTRPVKLKRFDRVIALNRGRVDFNGAPALWRQTKLGREGSDVSEVEDDARTTQGGVS